MITEIAEIFVKPGQGAGLEAGFVAARPLFARATGCLDAKLTRTIERPERYLLIIQWATLENHTVDFRESSDFQEWRAIIGPFLASPPAVEHIETLAL